MDNVWYHWPTQKIKDLARPAANAKEKPAKMQNWLTTGNSMQNRSFLKIDVSPWYRGRACRWMQKDVHTWLQIAPDGRQNHVVVLTCHVLDRTIPTCTYDVPTAQNGNRMSLSMHCHYRHCHCHQAVTSYNRADGTARQPARQKKKKMYKDVPVLVTSSRHLIRCDSRSDHVPFMYYDWHVRTYVSCRHRIIKTACKKAVYLTIDKMYVSFVVRHVTCTCDRLTKDKCRM